MKLKLSKENKNELNKPSCIKPTGSPVWTALASFLLPGLGQMLQKRYGSAVAYVFIYLPFALLPLAGFLGLIKNHIISREFAFAWLVTIFFLFLFIFMSVIDTLVWHYEKKTSFKMLLRILTLFALLLLIALLLPAISSVREAARRMQCGVHLRTIVFAFHDYHSVYHTLPPAYSVDANGKPLHSWRVLILPYIGQEDLYKQIRLDEPWDSEYNKQFHSQMPAVYRCPSQPEQFFLGRGEKEIRIGGCSYSVIVPFAGSPSAVVQQLPADSSINADTILIAERLISVNWMEPDNDIPLNIAEKGIDVDVSGLGSPHSGGCHCCMTDGMCRFLFRSAGSDTLKSMLVPAQKEPEK
ncbi:MAG: DUF1559 domain-containing protein [Planctomycetaceae bacterium]|nr:DUF1559 domain-containing protein [Planctomycetaceae bacterium]